MLSKKRLFHSVRCALLYLSLPWLASCSSLNQGAEVVDEWLLGMSARQPIISGYKVERQRHYPVAIDARLLIEGDDEDIVGGFQRALKAHFQHVDVLHKNEPKPQEFTPQQVAGFHLKVDKDQTASRLTIRITDISTNQTFDRVRIDFNNSSALSDDASVDRALAYAAESLVGL